MDHLAQQPQTPHAPERDRERIRPTLQGFNFLMGDSKTKTFYHSECARYKAEDLTGTNLSTPCNCLMRLAADLLPPPCIQRQGSGGPGRPETWSGSHGQEAAGWDGHTNRSIVQRQKGPTLNHCLDLKRQLLKPHSGASLHWSEYDHAFPNHIAKSALQTFRQCFRLNPGRTRDARGRWLGKSNQNRADCTGRGEVPGSH